MSAEPWADHPEYRALFAAVCEQPGDDAPRLVLADWLEEYGGPAAADRADFIRVQVELTKLPARDPRRYELRARERALLTAHEPEWLRPLTGLVSTAEFRRGFVDRVQVGARQFLEHAGKILALAPGRRVQLLRLNQTKFALRELTDNPHFRAWFKGR
jgi:uncharacterized protein (TIGR02996 family)